MGNANGTFFIKKAGVSSDGLPYYLIQVSGQNEPGNELADLCLHAVGGSIQGNNIALHGGVEYNMGNANGTFFIKQVGTSSDGKPYYVIQVSGQNEPGDGLADLCLHAVGGSIQGNNIALHGGVEYNIENPNGTFFIKSYDDFQNRNDDFQNRNEEKKYYCEGDSDFCSSNGESGDGIYKCNISNVKCQPDFYEYNAVQYLEKRLPEDVVDDNMIYETIGDDIDPELRLQSLSDTHLKEPEFAFYTNKTFSKLYIRVFRSDSRNASGWLGVDDNTFIVSSNHTDASNNVLNAKNVLNDLFDIGILPVIYPYILDEMFNR